MDDYNLDPVQVGDILYHKRHKIIGWVVEKMWEYPDRWSAEWADGEVDFLSEEAIRLYRHDAQQEKKLQRYERRDR